MRTIYYITIGIIVLLLIIATVSTCSSKRTARIITESELKTALINQEIDLRSQYLKIENEKIDSAKKAESRKTEQAKKLVVYHEARAKKYLDKANRLQSKLDSLKSVAAPCDEQLQICDDVNTELRNVIAENDTTIESLGQEAESYSKRLYLCEKQNFSYYMSAITDAKHIATLTAENSILIKDLKKKNNWLNRNKLWIGIGAGLVGGLIIK